MGVCMSAMTVSDDKIGQLLADPPLVWRVVEAENPHFYLRELGYDKRAGWLARLFSRLLGRRSEAPPVPHFRFSAGELRDVYLDKSWDGVNFCLRKLIVPGSCKNLFEDGAPVGDVEVYCGPVSVLTSDEVAAIAACYRPLTGADLLAQYRPEEMEDLYPRGLWNHASDDVTSYIVDNFAELKAFVEQAAQDRLGILVQYT